MVVMVVVVGDDKEEEVVVTATSKGLISWCNLPDFGSALGVVWSFGLEGQNLRLDALDFKYLGVEVVGDRESEWTGSFGYDDI